MRKRGQNYSTILVAVISFIVVVFLVVMAYRGISNMRSEKEMFAFENTLQQEISSVSGIAGKIKEVSLFFPSSVDRIYIVDNQKALEDMDFGETIIVDDGLKTQVGDNVYLFSSLDPELTFVLSRLGMKSPHYLCIQKNGTSKIDLRLSSNEEGVDLSILKPNMDCTVTLLVREVVTEMFGDTPEFSDKLDEFMQYLENVEKINVTKQVEYNPYDDKTRVTVKIVAEPPVYNLEYFEYLPKCLVKYASDLDLDDEIVLREDPLLKWDFGDATGPSYEKELTYLREQKKISEACEKMIASFAKGDGSKFSSGLIGGEISPYENSDDDLNFNNEDILPSDSDNDGFPDEWEDEYGFDPFDDAKPGYFIQPGDDIPIDLGSVTVLDFSLDKDQDGLSDYREYKFDSDPGNIDTDGDHTNDALEFYFRTDPNCIDSERFPEFTPGSFEWWAAPCVGDGIPDWWEIFYNIYSKNQSETLYQEVDNINFPSTSDLDAKGMNPHRNDSEEDYDGDGVSNFDEFMFGLNPLDEDSGNFGVPDGDKYGICSVDNCKDYSSFIERLVCCFLCNSEGGCKKGCIAGKGLNDPRNNKELCFSEDDDLDAAQEAYCPADALGCTAVNSAFLCIFCNNCTLTQSSDVECIPADQDPPPPQSSCNAYTYQADCVADTNCQWCNDLLYPGALSTSNCILKSSDCNCVEQVESCHDTCEYVQDHDECEQACCTLCLDNTACPEGCEPTGNGCYDSDYNADDDDDDNDDNN